MRILCVLLLATIFGVGCTSKSVDPIKAAGCSVEATVASAFSSAIASTLSCSSNVAIQNDLLDALGKANLCSKSSDATFKASAVKPQGLIGDIVCPIAVNSAMGLLGAKLPSSWNCKPGVDQTEIGDLLKAACSKAIGI